MSGGLDPTTPRLRDLGNGMYEAVATARVGGTSLSVRHIAPREVAMRLTLRAFQGESKVVLQLVDGATVVAVDSAAL